MSELRACIDAAASLRAQGEQCLVATVVDVHGSSYRKRGARMVFGERRWLAGSVSGGCLERDVLAKGMYRTRDGRAHLTTYDALTDERAGSGCGGVIDVLIERATSSADALTCPLNFAARCVRDETWGLFATVFRSERPDVAVGAHHAMFANGQVHSQLPSWLRQRIAMPAERAVSLHVEGVDVLIEQVMPPVHLFIFGGAHDALPLLQLAKTLGWTVSVCEPHAQLSSRERFRAADHHRIGPLAHAVDAVARCARPAAVVMSHQYDRDLAALGALLRTRVPYVGLLGARKRAARLVEDLQLDQATRARLHAPVGLALGAESPQEIALSIVAEVQREVASAPMHVEPVALAEPA